MTMTQFSTRLASKDSMLDNLGPFDGAPVVPSDTTDLPYVPGEAMCGLHTVSGGNIAINLFGAGGGTGVLTLAPGSMVMIGAKRVLATGTTATGISALYTPI